MRLVDLEPQFLRCESRTATGRFHHPDGYEKDPGHVHTDVCWYETVYEQEYHVPVATLAEAQGVQFLCPICFVANGGAVGTHSVLCWSRSRGAPDDASPGPGRWTLDGTGFEDLTLNGDPPGTARSVALGGGCDWHGFVTNGEVA